jgi:hypothetical protein
MCVVHNQNPLKFKEIKKKKKKKNKKRTKNNILPDDHPTWTWAFKKQEAQVIVIYG